MTPADGPLPIVAAALTGVQSALTMTLTPLAIVLLLTCVVAEVAYQLSFKTVADRADPDRHLRSVASQPLLWFGVALWAIEVVVWLAVLQSVPLDIAYPVMTLTYAAVPIAGVVALKEKMSTSQVAGATLIFAGVICVSLSQH